MSKKIYLIREYGGEYEDSWEKIVYAFLDEQKRDEKLKELLNRVDLMESYRDFWDNLNARLDSIELPDEYYDWLDGDIQGTEYDELYDNYVFDDSYERFVYWVKQECNDIYEQHSESFWADLYDYYIEYNCRYGNLYTSYFDKQDVEISDAE